MLTYPDLEIGIHKHDIESYSVELRFTHPSGESETRILGKGIPVIHANLTQLHELGDDAASYGRALWNLFFAEPQIHTAFAQALAIAQSRNIPLRLRLFIGPSAPELHGLHWEALRIADSDRTVLTDENVLFSRYLDSMDWRPVELLPQSDLRALIAIANPVGLEQYKLTPINVMEESARARKGLEPIAATQEIVNIEATLDNLISLLRDGYDILYLVCHGMFREGETWLWLADKAGAVERVAGSELVNRIADLNRRPRLVILVSCQSAGADGETYSSDHGALAALGPRLAEIGIPAVVAMQGNITLKTAADFIPVFTKELKRDGLIDRAIAAARASVKGSAPDWWAPALFMRLKSGRIWYVPGFHEDPQGFTKWPPIINNLSKGKCSAIIGPGIRESLFGPARDIARQLAHDYRYPMAPHEREDLPQVAQFLSATKEKGEFVADEYKRVLRRQIMQMHSDWIGAKAPNDLNQLINTIWSTRSSQEEMEPHKLLAKLPFNIYFTTNTDSLLLSALRAEGKKPQVDICGWYSDLESPEFDEDDHKPTIDGQLLAFSHDPDYRPSEECPLVYHLFGHLDVPHSLVLTEDNYFDYLIGVTRDRDLIPKVVRSTLLNSALLFIGFQMHDWNFRVLLRSIMRQEGRRRSSQYNHAAVQIDPEIGHFIEPEGARAYLKQFFEHSDIGQINVYWDSADDFVCELYKHWQRRES